MDISPLERKQEAEKNAAFAEGLRIGFGAGCNAMAKYYRLLPDHATLADMPLHTTPQLVVNNG